MNWRTIPGFEGHYEVSDTGIVKSLDRWVHPTNGSKPYFVSGCILKQTRNRRGYFKVNLYKQNEETTREVHRLVTLAFLGECPQDHEVRHIDGSRVNNHLSNLTYGTLSQNQQDRFKHGTACIGVKHPQCRLTDEQVKSVSDEYSKGNITMQQLAAKYEVVPSTIWRIINGHRRLTSGEKIRTQDREFSRPRSRRPEAQS